MNWNKYSKYFKPSEFQCKCCGKLNISEELVDRLYVAREKAGIPFVINSGYRCPKHNAEVGGKSDSAHKEGLAVDISAKDGYARFKILKALFDAGFERIGIDDKFIHADVDHSKPEETVFLY